MTNHPLRQVRILGVWQLVLGLGLALVTWGVAGAPKAVSFGVGVALSLGNLVALTWGWWRLFTQKRVAWTVLIIVIKYAVLLSSTFYLSRAAWFDVVAAGLGLASFTLPALVLAVFYQERESTGG